MEEMNKTSDCVLKSLSTCGMPQIQAMANELLELRAKAALEEKKEAIKAKPKPIPDASVELLISGAEDDLRIQTAQCLRELLEYRKRTRRPRYQKGDVVSTKSGLEMVSAFKGLSYPYTIGSWDYKLFIPLDSLKDLHE